MADDWFSNVIPLLNRIDERSEALEEGSQKQSGKIDDHEKRLTTLETIKESYIGNDEKGLRRVIREEITASNDKSGDNWVKWLTLILAVLGFGLAAAQGLHLFHLGT